MIHPIQKWKDLKKHVLDQINQIDNETQWSEREPEWWLEMRDVRELLLKKCEKGEVETLGDFLRKHINEK